MVSPSTQAEVLVVGAGPSGLVLALTLLQNGISVRIIEKSPEQRKGQRGAGIMVNYQAFSIISIDPATQWAELFHILGVGAKIMERSIPTPQVKLYDLGGGLKSVQTFEMAAHVDPTPSCPYLNILCLGQDILEGILRDELETKYNCRVELGTELVSFRQSHDRVNVQILKAGEEESTSFEWVGGTDGARGVVRKLLGATFSGETSNIHNIVVGDIMVDGLDSKYWHMWGDAGTTLVSLRPTEVEGLYNFILTGKDIDHDTLTASPELLQGVMLKETGASEAELRIGEITWLSVYRPNIRMVDKLGEGRVFLAGDSAHVHSFTGGQGMNTGIQDSFNLGWKMAFVHRKLSPYSLLRSYPEERLPVIEEMLVQTTSLMNETFNRKEKQSRPQIYKRDSSLLQLGVNYRWSSIVLDEQTVEDEYDDDFYDDLTEDDLDTYGAKHDGALKAGDRAPDAPELLDLKAPNSTSSTRLFDVFGTSYHTVLIFTNDPTRCASVISAIRAYPGGAVRSALVILRGQSAPSCADEADFVLEDRRAHAYEAYSLTEGCTLAIVRPDGVVGAVVRGPSGLKRYFEGIFARR